MLFCNVIRRYILKFAVYKYRYNFVNKIIKEVVYFFFNFYNVGILQESKKI